MDYRRNEGFTPKALHALSGRFPADSVVDRGAQAVEVCGGSQRASADLLLGSRVAYIDRLPDNVISKLLGYTVSSKVLTVTGNEAPYVGFGYIVCDVTAGTKTYKAYWFPKVQFGLENDNAKTKGESTEFQTNTLSGEILGVVTSSSGPTEFYYVESESTETAARSWLNGKAGIS